MQDLHWSTSWVVLKANSLLCTKGKNSYYCVYKQSFCLQVIDKCFVGTASRLSGVTFEILAQEVR